MKLGLIKKSMICVVSLSFCAILASCTKKASSNGSSNTTNIFTNKEIQDFARMYNKEDERINPTITLSDVNSAEVSILSRTDNAALLYNDTEEKYSIYLRKINNTIPVATDETESVTSISVITNYGNYDYILVNFSSGKKMLIDSFGETVIEKMETTGISFNKRMINNDSSLNGDISFYDFLSVVVEGKAQSYIFDITATVKSGMKFTEIKSRTKLEDEAQIDYDRASKRRMSTVRLKNYTVYYSSSTVILKDLNEKIVSTVAIDPDDATIEFISDDKLFFQTKTAVTLGDDYTYTDGTNYYLLKTYSVDLKSGIKEEIKDYKYVVDDFDEIYGLSKERSYVAGITADLYEIVDKRLSLTGISATVDAKGNILSSKIGEKGTISYIGNDTFAIYDGPIVTVMNAKGKQIISSPLNSGFKLLSQSKAIFMGESMGYSYGYLLDYDLKHIKDEASNYYILNTFSNENMIMYNNGQYYIAQVDNNEVKVVSDYFDANITGLTIMSGMKAGRKYICSNSALIQNDIYIVEYLEADATVSIEIYTCNGESLKKYEKVTGLSSSTSSYVYSLTVSTEDGTYYVQTSKGM